jgi:6-phosphogluconolactonase/glucosamine-6-phosphate isomerase/deaminase
MDIQTFPSSELALQRAVSELTVALQEALSQEKDVLLLLSGGSNLKVLDQIDKAIINSPKVTKFVLDERFSADPQENNSLQIEALGIHIHLTVPKATDTLQSFAARFNDDLKLWIKAHPQGKIICTLGMGPDGHIAGIGPMIDDAEAFQKTFFDTDKLVVGYTGSLVPPKRVTITPQFLTKNVDTVIGLILGESKRGALTAFKNETTAANVHPAQILHRAKGQLIIMTDIQLD